MTPSEIAGKLAENQIDWAAITDHNSARNVTVFKEVFEEEGIAFIPGIEVQTYEDVHVLGYFPDCETAAEFGQKIEDKLPDYEINPERDGYQLVVDRAGNFTDMVLRPLSMPADISLDETLELIDTHNGIGIYAHIDKAMGVIYQLGIIPPEPVNTPCEIYMPKKLEQYKPQLKERAVLSSSDAHNLDSFGNSKMAICCHSRTFVEFKGAINHQDGRDVRICR